MEPQRVFCRMTLWQKNGTDIALSATITCKDISNNNNGVNNNSDKIIPFLSGAARVPGGETGAVGKQADVQVYGKDGALLYAGNDKDPNDSDAKSGHMELRQASTGSEIEEPSGDGFLL